jgi:hypothetical protein
VLREFHIHEKDHRLFWLGRVLHQTGFFVLCIDPAETLAGHQFQGPKHGVGGQNYRQILGHPKVSIRYPQKKPTHCR